MVKAKTPAPLDSQRLEGGFGTFFVKLGEALTQGGRTAVGQLDGGGMFLLCSGTLSTCTFPSACRRKP